ncbi:MAG: alpha/beta hydrolase fold domain-containing protein [Robiginitalea sp.]
MKKSSLIPLLLFLGVFTLPALGQGVSQPAGDIEKQTLAYVERDSVLYLDFYQRKGDPEVRPCVIFVFGGGFAAGSRDREFYRYYFETLARNGLKVASIDYRLGLKGIYDEVGIFNTKPLENAIDMAVEDLYQATAFLLDKSEELQIDPSRIIVTGSSAGAITSLQGDWYARNKHELSQVLPEGFQYSGVVAFAGAIFSTEGKPEYEMPPAPTLFFHGTEDNTVPYNKRKLLNKGFFGSNYLARQFEKNDYEFHYIRQVGAGHEIATTPMKERLLEILRFIESAVLNKASYQVETTLIPLND